MGPIGLALPVLIFSWLPMLSFGVVAGVKCVTVGRSARRFFRGVVSVSGYCLTRGVQRCVETVFMLTQGCASGRRQRLAVPFAVLTRLVAAGGNGGSSVRELAVEQGHSARVRSETDRAIAGSFGESFSEGRAELPSRSEPIHKEFVWSVAGGLCQAGKGDYSGAWSSPLMR